MEADSDVAGESALEVISIVGRAVCAGVVLTAALYLLRALCQSMAWKCGGDSQAELVNNLRKNGIIKTERVYQVMLATDRCHYAKSNPYTDSPQSIGFQATISAPHMHAYALELLHDHLTEGARALDVGSGSGILTSCFARMAGPSGKVVGIEHIKDLVNDSINNVKKDDPSLLSSGRVKFIVGDGRQGYSEEAPYDAIHVGAAASTVPQAVSSLPTSHQSHNVSLRPCLVFSSQNAASGAPSVSEREPFFFGTEQPNYYPQCHLGVKPSQTTEGVGVLGLGLRGFANNHEHRIIIICCDKSLSCS